MKSFIIDKEENLIDIAKYLIKKANSKKNIISLNGDLGAGKTTLTKFIAKELGVKSEITSPTFNIVKEYKTKNKIFKNLYHFDIYRINEIEELDNIGFFEYLYSDNSLCIVEWGNNIEGLLPEDKKINVNIGIMLESRRIEIGD